MVKRIKPVAYLSAAVLLVVCCGGKIYGILPFGTPMFCALSGEFFIGFAAPIFLLCEFLFTLELWRLYTAGAVIFIMAVRWTVSLRVKAFERGYVKTLFAFSALFVHAALATVFSPAVDAVITGFIGGVFYFFAVRVAECAETEFRSRPGAVDGAALAAAFFVAGLALSRARYGGYIIGLAPTFFALLLVGKAGNKALFVLGEALALGLGLNCGAPVAASTTACILALVAFGALPRPLYTVVAAGAYCATAVLFRVEPTAVGKSAIMLAAGLAPFLLVPRRTLNALSDYFDFDGSARLAVRHYINRVKADAGNKMLSVASVFDETARLLASLTPAPPDYAAMGEALADKVCPYCTARDACDKNKAREAFTALAEISCSGRAILGGLPEFFTEECARAAEAVSASSSITENARERARETECEQKAKAIIAERLAAVKDVLEDVGKAQAAPVGFDGDAEKRIALELNNDGMDCAEAFCTRDGITAIVRTATASREKLRRAAEITFKRGYEVRSLEKTQAAGWSVAFLKRRPKYDAVYARAGVGKDGVSGDSYTFKRIGDRFLAALLDGMGSGEKAGAGSGAAAELIECFYRAGFDSRSVIAGVNRFLKLPSSESYSAADVAVIDLDVGTADIVKLGAPPCYIKTTDTVIKISGSSLPIGVVDEIRPFVASKKLYPGQMLVLVTDGVSDCFSGDGLAEFINGLSPYNPELAVNSILSRALEASGGTPKDDMTAIAVRLYEKRIKR